MIRADAGYVVARRVIRSARVFRKNAGNGWGDLIVIGFPHQHSPAIQLLRDHSGKSEHGVAHDGLGGLVVGHILHLPVEHEDAAVFPDHDVALADAHIIAGFEIGVGVRVADLGFPVDGEVQSPQIDGLIALRVLGVPVPDQLKGIVGVGHVRIEPVLKVLLLCGRYTELHVEILTAG